MNNEHREQAREIALKIAIQAERDFMDAKDNAGKYRPEQTTALAERIATALSSRDAEIKEVLEGLSGGFQDLNNVPCWCFDNKPPHSPACLAARALYAKLGE